ncbi:MAG: flagellar assembly protein FliH [Azoarcus sp.]|nr:flagellar assembly protein FliH [Azoarcus sp.]
MKTALTVFALVVLAFVVPFFIPFGGTPEDADADADHNLPWQIGVDAAGNSEVFGLKPGQSTLADARARFGDDFEVAIVAAPNETGALEAYYGQISLGFVRGYLIFTLNNTPEEIAAIYEHALKREYMGSGARKIILHPDDRARAESTVIRAITVIPRARLDESTIVARFGQPAEILPEGKTLAHYLYPEKGLDIVFDRKGKEILHYVAPQDFDAKIRAQLPRSESPTGEKEKPR